MKLNTYLALAVAVILLFSPLILVTAPIWGIWVAWQLALRRRRGYRTLWPFMARTARLYARAMIPADAPGGDWENVPRNLDKYIADARSPRVWRIKLVLTVMEIAPILRLRPLFSMMSDAGRRKFVDRYLTAAGGIMRVPAIGRQLVRLGYYATPETHDQIDFIPMPKRAKWRQAQKQQEELTSV